MRRVDMDMATGRHLFLASCQYAFGMTDEFPSRSLDKVIVRLPDGMRDRLKAEAEGNKRSMNAEIVARLESSLLRDQRMREAAARELPDGKRLIPEDMDFSLTDAIRQVTDVLEYIQKFKLKRNEKGEVIEIFRVDPEVDDFGQEPPKSEDRSSEGAPIKSRLLDL